MKQSSLVPLLAVTALALLGCGSDDPVDRYLEHGARIQELCRCPAAFAHTDEATCREQVAEEFALSAEAERCLRDVHAAHARALKAPLDCILDANDAHLACAEHALRLCPPSMDEVRACNEQFARDSDGCPLPPDHIAAMFDACLAR